MASRRPWLARHSSKFVMKCLFRPLFGWRDSEQHGLEYFSFIGRDMSRLEAARKLAKGVPAKGVVLLCHPFLKFGMSYFFKNSYHEKLNQAGYHVVSFNFKGFGSSTVESMNFADDVASIVDWARHTYPDLPLHFWGVSFGAFHGMHAIGSGRARFDSALFDSAPVSLVHFFGKGALGLVMRSLSRSRWGHLTGTHDVFQSFPLPAELPRLYMFGADDAFITSHELHRLQELVGHDCIRRFANCGHLEIRKTYQDEYFGQALAFLDQHSRTKPSLTLA
ncbi:alpha/beta fold hydrolase [Undibacterium cyanobacteriorum]|uniref:Alpha/beta fold hydrolase n=1 Tax=Undibacterium cyanobacteriorum TaxID=3073561 RepID=A0ABY9RK07_9BURK|nr:alpha/beta fold hydrolase [Undibacterium sp. 20NA77.5]WMW81548.1 alpha/beta fold hydrolase [Undibacterium sp. 20NA77.5]